jgi:hypothetical protein
MRSEVLMAVTVKSIIFRNVTPCSLVDADVSEERAFSVFIVEG